MGWRMPIALKNWIEGDPDSLTTEQAQEIMSFKKRSTYRALTDYFLGYVCQMEGRWLSRDAASRITGLSSKELYDLAWDANSDFCKEHKHRMGEFFWW